jgi:hypothetical protein
MAVNLDHFDALTTRGLKIIPLWENSKAPMCRGWTGEWSWAAAREKLAMFPAANLGLLLGDIVDVEGDSAEANRAILDLIGDYPHPSYVSTKSIHHLFVSPDPALRHFRVGEIEFRGHGHQSVIPPSQHQGTVYKWLRAFRFPVPEMPPALQDFYRAQRAAPLRNPLKPGHVRVWCADCRGECRLHRKRFDLEVEAFRLLGSRWECQKCRSLDLRPACRLIRSGVAGRVVRMNALGGV